MRVIAALVALGFALDASANTQPGYRFLGQPVQTGVVEPIAFSRDGKALVWFDGKSVLLTREPFATSARLFSASRRPAPGDPRLKTYGLVDANGDRRDGTPARASDATVSASRWLEQELPLWRGPADAGPSGQVVIENEGFYGDVFVVDRRRPQAKVASRFKTAKNVIWSHRGDRVAFCGVADKHNLVVVVQDDAPPPFLELAATFDDSASNADGKLQQSELALLRVTIRNTGAGDSGALTLHARSRPDLVPLRTPRTLVGIPAGGAIAFSLPVVGPVRLPPGPVAIELIAKEARGFDAAPATVSFVASAAEAPRLSLIKGAPFRVESGSIDVVRATLKNGGPGPSFGTLVIGRLPSAICPSLVQFAGSPRSSRDALGRLVGVGPCATGVLARAGGAQPVAAGEVVEVPFSLKVPITTRVPKFDLAVTAWNLARGDSGEPAAREIYPVQVQPNAPRFEVSHAVHDGDGVADSRGNANGKIEPGEIVALETVFRNLGKADAPDVSVTLDSSAPGVVLTKPAFRLGWIRSGAAATVFVGATVQRSVRPGPIQIGARFRSEGFPESTATIQLNVAPPQPPTGPQPGPVPAARPRAPRWSEEEAEGRVARFGKAMWHVRGAKRMKYLQAVEYCRQLVVGAVDAWRLPREQDLPAGPYYRVKPQDLDAAGGKVCAPGVVIPKAIDCDMYWQEREPRDGGAFRYGFLKWAGGYGGVTCSDDDGCGNLARVLCVHDP